MALIKCKECGKDISENASTCPNCGNPNTLTTEQKKEEIKNRIEEQNTQGVIAGLITLVVLVAVFFGIKGLWNWLEGDKLLNAVGIDTSNNTIVVHEKDGDQIKDDFMNWLGFEKVEE